MITIFRQVSVLGTIVCALAIILISSGMDLDVVGRQQLIVPHVILSQPHEACRMIRL